MTNEADYQEQVQEVFEQLRTAKSQLGAEDWIEVRRTGDAVVRARPVDRQDDRAEAEQVTSDTWLIEDVSGEQYVVGEKTFESEFVDDGRLTTRTIEIDVSWDDVENEDGPDLSGADCVITTTALVDARTDSVIKMDVESVHYAYGDTEELITGGIPMGAVFDSTAMRDVTNVSDDETDE